MNLAQTFDLSVVSTMPDTEAAVYLFDVIRQIEELERKAFALRGLVLLMVEKRELWRVAGYSSMNQWILGAAPWSHGSCHEAMRTVQQLHDVPMEDLVDMPRCTLVQLGKLSTAVRAEPKVITAAKTLTEEAFAEKMMAEYPEQHIEPVIRPTLRLTGPVQDALDLVGSLMSIEDRQGQLEALCVDFVVERQGIVTAEGEA